MVIPGFVRNGVLATCARLAPEGSLRVTCIAHGDALDRSGGAADTSNVFAASSL
jgi:hypothetical protein